LTTKLKPSSLQFDSSYYNRCEMEFSEQCYIVLALYNLVINLICKVCERLF